MNDRMLVQRKLAATPTFTPPKSTPLTPSSTQKPAAAPPQAVTEVQPSPQEVQTSNGKQETPDLQAQLERAARFGHHFGRISVLQPQAKLTVNQPEDPQEQQANQVADRVMSLPAPKPLLRPTLRGEVSDHTLVQPKLTIGQAGDQYEQEADRVADQVMANSQGIQRQGEEEEQQEAVLLKPLAAEITPVIQRQVGLEEEPLQMKRSLQRQADTSAKTSSNLESQLQATKGGGSPLPDEVRDFMEPRIGADFSSVRVHTDEKAFQMNKELNAQAFTHGRDVYFGAGKYNPGSNDGKRLLAHELTHVVQQTGRGQLRIQAKADPGQILERLKNTRPTSAPGAYEQAQTASAGALAAQKQQLQQSLPKIPAPTGLPAQKSGSKKTKGKAAAGNKETLSLGVTKQKSGQAGKEQSGQSDAQLSQSAQNALGSIRLDTSQISTKAGKSPAVDMTGEADPSQMDSAQRESSNQVRTAKAEAAKEIHQDFGENNIFPEPNKEILKANKALSSAKAPAGKAGKAPEIPGEVIGSLNKSLGPVFKERIGEQQEKYTIGKHKFEKDTAKARTDTDRKIAKLNQETSQKQLKEQQLAKAEVAQSKQEWQTEINTTEKQYQEKAGQATQEQKKKIAQEKQKGEQTASKHIEEAEKKAEEEKKKAEKEESQQKSEAEKESGGLLGRVKSAATALIDGLKKAVNFIYDNLRKAVKFIFEQAKKLVVAAIELARKAIVGLIKGLGTILKGLVSVVFAAFPNIAKKINSFIDKAINAAVKAVNTAANLLKKGVSAVLDFLANTLDSLLGLIQSIYNGIFTVIGMIVRGEFAELMKRIGNLIKAAKAAPSQFQTAALEELLGGNLDEPLSPAELAQTGVTPKGAAGKAIPQTGQADSIPSPPWSEANVGVDAVDNNMELSPELSAELMEQTKGQGEVEIGASNDATRTMDSVMSEVTGQKEGKQKEQANNLDDGLSPKQRAEIRWKLMKTGISQWWSKNWPLVIGGATLAIGGFIALNVVTGGAITAALPAIMSVVGPLFAGVTIAQVGGHVRDYLAKGWEGDIQGGGKSLAKGLAAGAIELVSYLTFKAGGAALKGAKALAKGGVKLAKGAVNLIAKGAKFIIEKGKVLFKGIAGSGIGKQFKRLRDLGEGLLNRMRFKKFSITISGRRIQLWGHINPKILLASIEFEGEKGKEALEGYLESIRKSGDKMDNALRQKLTQLAEDFAQQVNRGQVTEAMEKRLKNMLEELRPQHVESNPVLKEVWERTQKRMAAKSKWSGKFNSDGTLKPATLKDKALMTQLYTEMRGDMNNVIKTVMDDINKAIGPMKNQLASLPVNVQLHHLLYKAKFPQFAVTPENLVLALRKVGGASDELHDLLHYISAGANKVIGTNRFKTLLDEMATIIKEVYGL